MTAVLASACSSSAINTRWAGGPIMGQIQSSSDDNLCVGDDETSSVPLLREDIQDIGATRPSHGRRRVHVTFAPVPRLEGGTGYLWLGVGAAY